MMRWLIFSGMIIGMCFTSSWATLAQDERNLPFNSAQSETTTDTEQRWSFIGASNGIYSVLVEPTDSNLDPRVRIEDARGRILIQNDDFDYPNSRIALIEGFTLPNSGVYDVIVEGFGGTQGAYAITLYNGYSQVTAYENFASTPWATFKVPDDGTNNPADDATSETDSTIPANTPTYQIETTNGGMRVEVEGIQAEVGLLGGYQLNTDAYYATIKLRSVQGRNGWQAGMVFGYRDAENYFAYLIDQRGYWRIIRHQDGIDRVLRDWVSNPAINSDNPDFSMAILTYENMVELFYNDEFVHSITVSDSEDTRGDVGALVRTVNSFNSQTQVIIDDFILTEPRQMDTMPQMITPASGNTAIRNLQRQHMIDPGGLLFLSLDETRIRDTDLGISRFPLAQGNLFSDFALGVQIDWNIDNRVLGGCGIVVHDAIETNAYGIAFVDNEGAYTLTERDGDNFVSTIFQTDTDLIAPPYHLLLIHRDGTLHLYVDYQYRGNITLERTQGAIGTAIVNYEAILSECIYRDLWLWKPDVN